MNPFRNKWAFISLVSLTAILFLFWATLFYVNHLFINSREAALEENLKTVADSFVRLINSDDSSLFLEFADPDLPIFSDYVISEINKTISYDLLRTHAQNFVELQNLSSLKILDGGPKIIFDSTADYSPGDFMEISTREYGFIQNALDGATVVTTLQELKHFPNMTLYQPLYNDVENRIVAVLMLEKSRTYWDEVHSIRNGLLTVGGLFTFLLLIVGWIQSITLNQMANMEATVAQEDRLKSLGTLAAGLAHEMRNPLSILRGTAEEIKLESQDNKEAQTLSDDLIEEIDRLNKLIEQVLEFSKAGSSLTDRENRCNIHELIHAVLQFMHKNLQKNSVNVECHLHDDNQWAAMPPTALRQVLFNILLNAAEASEKNGSIRIRTRPSTNDKVVIEIQDYGSGISNRELKRIFEPFFSTKPTGTGLGLSISRQIVERSGGTLQLKSQKGKGTLTRIVLPAAKQPSTPATQDHDMDFKREDIS